MGKAPAFQFYPDDFLRDTLELSLAGRGCWITLLCKMWHSVTPGRISMPMTGYARMFGSTVDQSKAVIDELVGFGICDAETIEREGTAILVLSSRRMLRDVAERAADAERKRRERAGDRNGESPPFVRDLSGECPANVQRSSSSSSSSSSTDLQRWIDSCVREHSKIDPRLVEIAVIETLMRRKGSAQEGRDIKSVRYFDEEIKRMAAASTLGDKSLDALLKRRREQQEKI